MGDAADPAAPIEEIVRMITIDTADIATRARALAGRPVTVYGPATCWPPARGPVPRSPLCRHPRSSAPVWCA